MKEYPVSVRLGLILMGIVLSSSVFISSAQTNSTRVRPDSQRSFLDTPLFTNSPAARALVSNILLTPVPAQSLPVVAEGPELRALGTFWSLQKSNQPPWPGRFFPELPTYEVAPNHFIVDDRSVDYPALHALRAAAVEAEAGPMMLMETVAFDYSSTTNLWLEIRTNGVASNLVQLIVHNTSEGLPYTLLTKTDLALPAWTPELIVTGAVGNVSLTQLSQNTRTNLFIWAHTGVPAAFITITTQPLDQEVLEADMVTFSVVASSTGGGNLTYQWTRNGVAIPGATSSSYTMDVVWGADEGGYAVLVSNGQFSFVSRTAQLTVSRGTDKTFYTRLIGPRQDYQFKRGHTYYIGMAVDFYGTTVVEGGAVIKFDSYFSDASLRIKDALVCRTEPYFPAILTSVDDDSAGEAEPWSTHDPQPFTNGWPYLDLSAASSGSVSNLHFRFADRAISIPESSRRLDIWHSQFYACYSAVENYAGAGAVLDFHNVLLAGCGTAVLALTNNYAIEAEHLTAHVSDFWFANTPPARMSLTNSIIQGTFSGGGIVQTQSTSINAPSLVFQPTAYGHYYLPENSPGHRAGTTNISPAVLTALRHKTTYAPLVLPGSTVLKGETTFFPTAPRYTNGLPDVGYYYDALDYVVADLRLQTGTLTIEPGTALAAANLTTTSGGWIFNGVRAENGAHLISRGTPTTPNIFTTTKLVQEVPPTEFAAIGFSFGIVWLVSNHNPFVADAIPPRLEFEFTKFYLPYEDYHLWAGYRSGTPPLSYESLMDWSLKDCELHGGQVYLGRSHPLLFGGTDYLGSGSVTWRNSLFDMVNLWVDPSYYRYFGVVDCDLSLVAENNLFREGAWLYLSPLPATNGNWRFHDNLFDQVHFLRPPTNAPLVMDYNGYWPVAPADTLWAEEMLLPLASGGGNELTLTAPPPYQSGPLGRYYLPQLTPLYHAASRTAGAAGLYQYTTRTNQFTAGQDYELFGGNGNIGLHYVATPNAVSSKPKDTDGDGVPDYVEDGNGNGAVDGNETSPDLAMTDGVTADAYSTVYDDLDLDGDGMKGTVERLWFKNPSIPDNPLALTNLTTDELTGVQEVALNVSNLEIEDAAALDLVLIGENESGVSPALVAAPLTEWDEAAQKLVWHTGYDRNGETPVQLRLSSIESGQTVFGPMRPVKIHNPVQVLDSLQSFGSQFSFEAQTELPNGKYRVWFYDQNGTPLTYTNGLEATHFSISGDIDATGRISFIWDLIYPNASAFQGDSILATVRVEPATQEGAAFSAGVSRASSYLEDPCVPGSLCPPFNWNRETNWPGNDKFLTFFARYLPQEETEDPQRYFTLLAANAPLKRTDVTGTGSAYDLNPESNWIETAGFPSTSQLREWTWKMTSANKTNVLDRMAEPDYRNLFFNGHGQTDGIGSYQPGEGIYSRTIRKKLGNQAQHFQGNQHPYRLVFIYACCTGRGSMCRSFGIPRKVMTVTDFQKRGVRARAFIGSRDATAGPSFENYTIAATEAGYISRFFTEWRRGQTPLGDILSSIKGIMQPGQPEIPGIIGDYVIYGATDLLRGSQP